MRGEDMPMLTCSGSRVARLCSADHQKMASKKAALGGSLTMGRHKDICGVLSKWREGVKDGVAPDSRTADWWRFWSDECAMPQRRRGSARGSSLITGPGRRPVTGCQSGDAGERAWSGRMNENRLSRVLFNSKSCSLRVG
jgi:hypothetical protein